MDGGRDTGMSGAGAVPPEVNTVAGTAATTKLSASVDRF